MAAAGAAQTRPWRARYDDGVDPDLALDPASLPELLARSVARNPRRAAVLFQGTKLTYAALAERIERLAAGLAGLGVGRGTRVAVHLPNLPQTVVGVYALWRLGAQVVMTNPLYVERELEHQWHDAGCELALTTDFLYARVLVPMAGRLPVRQLVIASIPDVFGFPRKLLARWALGRRRPPLVARVAYGPDIHAFEGLIASDAPAPPMPQLAPEDVALLQYTGGTTGRSKGAVLTHRNLSANAQQMRAWLSTLREDREVFLGVLPFFHVFGLSVGLNLPLALGATLVLRADPRDTAGMIDDIERQRVTTLAAVPTMFHGIAQHPGVERRDLSSVRACLSGSAPLALDTLQAFERITGATIVEGYGLTETSPLTHCNPLQGERRVGTVGLPVPCTDARIVDPEDASVLRPAGQEGELVVKGPQVMAGYWKREEETAAVLHDGWLLTGDLAVMDEDGYFRIVGRKKDLIIAGGYNVYPDEIDDVLVAHPAVSEACTIGVPHPRRGETVKAFVVLAPGASASAEELIGWCRERLAAYKVPSALAFREELPRSSMMKVLRRELRASELAEGGGTAQG